MARKKLVLQQFLAFTPPAPTHIQQEQQCSSSSNYRNRFSEKAMQ
jgi:hypothetical protein